jgi:hypothetical protein
LESEKDKYPRDLTLREKKWLLYLLPEDRQGYAVYRDKIEDMVVIGDGRFGDGNYFLGYKGDEPDLSYSSLPMFASGQIICKECIIQISIHEFYDNKIEFSINSITGDEIPEELTEIRRWSYSYWSPHKASFIENDKLREVELMEKKDEAVLVFSLVYGTIWLFDNKTQINLIIPVTNFVNELLRGNTKIEKTKGINIKYVFEHLDMFGDNDITKAFVQYNKQYHKISLPDAEIAKPKEKGLVGKLFK